MKIVSNTFSQNKNNKKKHKTEIRWNCNSIKLYKLTNSYINQLLFQNEIGMKIYLKKYIKKILRLNGKRVKNCWFFLSPLENRYKFNLNK